MVGSKVGKTTRPAASCTECQRRKQKCSRQWPCNHCQSRNIPHLCKYPQKGTSRTSKCTVSSAEASSRKTFSDKGVEIIKPERSEIAPSESSVTAAEDELRDLGYMPNDRNLLSETPVSTKTNLLNQTSTAISSEMKSVLQILPAKPYTDILVQQFLGGPNFGYACLYPPTFSHEYAAWWSDRASGKPLTSEFTCLLIRVCACSAQFLPIENKRKLESELGESVQSLSESYHHAAKQLSNTITPGKGGLAQIQQLFLTSAWLKSEALFVESWHALGCAIHEAQEQGLHKNSLRPSRSEFDLEMRRRLWCLLYTWDWQMSILLSRPLIINQADPPFELPSMQLESHTTGDNGPPSPFLHIAMQCELGRIVTKVPLTTGGMLRATDPEDIQTDMERWLASLPPAYQETGPDMQWDDEYTHVPLQRRILHAIGYMTMFLPFKAFLTKTITIQSNETDKARRATAVDISLHLMKVSHRLFDYAFPLNAKFHIVTFLIFDTAAYLCSAMIHDKDLSLPQRDRVTQAVAHACSLMAKLATVTKTGAFCYPVLIKLAKSLPAWSKSTGQADTADCDISNSGTDISGPSSFFERVSPEPLSSSLDPLVTGTFMPASFDIPVPGMETPPIMGMGDFSNLDVGQFDQIWDWQDLDLTLLPSLPG